MLKGEESMIRQSYEKVLYRKEGFYPYADEQGAFEARIKAIEPTGHLVLQLRDGSERTYAFKEVSYVK